MCIRSTEISTKLKNCKLGLSAKVSAVMSRPSFYFPTVGLKTCTRYRIDILWSKTSAMLPNLILNDLPHVFTTVGLGGSLLGC